MFANTQLGQLKEAADKMRLPPTSYPGQMKQRRDVYNPAWRAWAKLKPLEA